MNYYGSMHQTRDRHPNHYFHQYFHETFMKFCHKTRANTERAISRTSTNNVTAPNEKHRRLSPRTFHRRRQPISLAPDQSSRHLIILKNYHLHAKNVLDKTLYMK